MEERKATVVRIPVDTHRNLRIKSVLENCSMNDLVVKAVEKLLEEDDKYDKRIKSDS